MESASAALTQYTAVPALVVGASGFLGRWTARRLSRSGAETTLAVRDRRRAEPILRDFGVEGRIVEADANDRKEIERLVAAVRPAILFNLAGYGVDRSEQDPDGFRRLNAELPEWLCRAIAEVSPQGWPGRRIVHAGSIAEYGPIGGDLAEDSTPRPGAPYARSKLAGTLNLLRACDTLGVSGVAARVSTAYGPGERTGRLLPSLLEAARRGAPVALSAGAQKRDFIYAADVAEGLLRLGAASADRGEVVNLATGRLMSVREFAETAAAALGLPAERLRFGALETRSEEESEHRPINIGRLVRQSSWSPQIGVADGVARTAAFGPPAVGQ